MSTEQVKTRNTLLPGSLTDKELIRYADKYLHTCGLPHDFQVELLKRFEDKVNNQ